tara:strand:- start:59 stop:259 length:201 start_codon:yes stop_codon:yes gene_type:complete
MYDDYGYDVDAAELEAKSKAAEKRRRMKYYAYLVKDGGRHLSIHLDVDEAMVNCELGQKVEVVVLE